jgi:ABC-type branched-subunit amino acid transport system substrate-binding protein
MGLRADVTVLDQGDEPAVWNNVLRRPEVKEQDLFIGPFHRTAIEQLSRTNNRAHIVCPVPQTNKLLLGHPRVSKVSPTRTDLVRHTGRYVAQRHARENIILLRPEIPSESELQDQMHRALQEARNKQSLRHRDSVLVMRPGQRDIGDIASRMDATKMNVVVAPSEDLEFVMALVAKLKGLSNKFRITLVGMASWTGYDMVAASDLDLLNFMFAAGQHIDKEEPRVQEFIQRYQQRFNNEPDEYAFLGFDVTLFYLKALLASGTDIVRGMDEVRIDPLHMNFRMTGSGPENGYRNEYAVMLQQKDLRLVKAP